MKYGQWQYFTQPSAERSLARAVHVYLVLLLYLDLTSLRMLKTKI
jgi:hypothetical protein